MDNVYTRSKTVDIPEEALRQSLENNETVGFVDRLSRTIQQAPFLAAGVAGLTIVCGIGAYKWKTKSIPPQLFLMQLRVIAQSTALGCITVGMVYHMYKDYVSRQKPT